MKGTKKEIDEFERELNRTLRRVDAPETFTQNVMAAVDNRSQSWGWGIASRVLVFPRQRAWIGSVAASLLLAGLLVDGVEHRRAAERNRAEKDFATSLEITDRAMRQTRLHLQKAGVVLD